jgi:hypothetical protein
LLIIITLLPLLFLLFPFALPANLLALEPPTPLKNKPLIKAPKIVSKAIPTKYQKGRNPPILIPCQKDIILVINSPQYLKMANIIFNF